MNKNLLAVAGLGALVAIFYQGAVLLQTGFGGSPSHAASLTSSVIDAFDPSLVGYWPFDEGAGTAVNDISATRDNGAFVGGASWIPGNVGTAAAQFNGSNYVDIPDNAAMHFGTSTPFSVSLWAKATGPTGTFITTFPAVARHSGYSITYGAQGVIVDLRVYDSVSNEVNDCAVGGALATSTINDGRWHHIVAVVNRNPSCTVNDVYIYVDHAEQRDQVYNNYHSASNQDISGIGPIVIGGNNYYGSLSGGLTGAVDDVRVFTQALNASEVDQLYQLGKVGASPCPGSVCVAASCAQSDVQSAIDSVNDGDTVMVPAGKCAWTSALQISKTITLQGAGSSTGGTEIDYATSTAFASPHTLMHIDVGGKTGKLDISGFFFSGGDRSFWDGTAMQLYGPVGWKNARIHDNTFGNNAEWAITGGAYTDALVDHNYFYGTSASGLELHGAGASDWTKPLTLGADDFFFIENNTFAWPDDQGGEGHATIDFTNGGRIVVRNNHIRNGLVETHDRARGGLPSANAFEIYNNDFAADSGKWEGINVSSGTGVVWGNTFTGPWQIPIGGLDYKTIDTNDRWNNGTLPCNGLDPLDQNTPGQTGWRCQYQLGSQGAGPTAVSVPAYVWGNTSSGAPTPLQITDGAVHLQSGRDYFNGVAKPGYAPYQYPHPLDTDPVTASPSPSPSPSPTISPTVPMPPVISSIGASAITSSGVVISWSTDEAADSQVDYGPTSAYGNSSALDSSLVLAHSATISSLSSNALYHYRVRSRDSAGDVAVSPDQTFTTAAAVVATSPSPSPSPSPTISPSSGPRNPTVTLNRADLNPFHIPLNSNFDTLDPGATGLAAQTGDWLSGVRRNGGNLNSGWNVNTSQPTTLNITYTITEFDGSNTSKPVGSGTATRTVIVDPAPTADLYVESVLANIWDAIRHWFSGR